MAKRGHYCKLRMEASWRWRTCGVRMSRFILSTMLLPLLTSELLCHASLEASQEHGGSGLRPRLSRELTSGLRHKISRIRGQEALGSSSSQPWLSGQLHAEDRLLGGRSTWERQTAAPYFRSAGERVFSLASVSSQAGTSGTSRGTRELLQQRRPFGIQVVRCSCATQKVSNIRPPRRLSSFHGTTEFLI